MENLLELLKSDNFILISFVINILLFVAVIVNSMMLNKTKREYLNFMKKIGNGNNLDEMLKTYLADVKEIKKKKEAPPIRVAHWGRVFQPSLPLIPRQKFALELRASIP